MIDSDAREALSQDVRRLIAGRMTNDEFDDAYFDTYEPCDDRAVSEVGSFGYCLYGDGLYPFRLRGRHAVDREARSTGARAVLFLKSGLEYEWPPAGFHWLEKLRPFATQFGAPAGIVLSVLCIPVFLSEPSLVIGLLALLGTALLTGSVAVAFLHRAFVSRRWKSFRESGDFDVWPFLRRSDFDEARASCQLLAK